MKLIRSIQNYPHLWLGITSILLGIFLIHQDREQLEECHQETKGKLNGFSLYSNKIVEVKIEYFINDVRYETSIPCGEHLQGFFYSKEKNKVIGKPCIVYYACDNPRNIQFYYEKDSIK